MKVTAFGRTDIGRARGHNEDNFLVNLSLGLFAVADGMGGHNAGEVASQLALDILSTEVVRFRKLIDSFQHGPTPSLRRQIVLRLEGAVQKASDGIFQAAKGDAGTQGMGTTLSVLLCIGRSAFIAHVGDSRIYLIRNDGIHRMTEDHTLLNEQLRKGALTEEEAENFPYTNVITRGVGILESVQVDTLHLDILPGDRFLLCSDGLYEYLSDEEIPKMFDDNSLQQITRTLIQLANDRGGKDNITALAVQVPDLPTEIGDIQVNRKLDALKEISLFHQLGYSELIKTLNIAHIEHFDKGDYIIREKEEGNCIYIILSGAVDVLKENIYLTSLAKGGHFGEMALISNDSRSATIRAAKDCDLLAIERADFYQLMSEEPHLAVKILMNFIGVLSDRLRQTTQAFSESRRKITEFLVSN